jgi:hypothetical protein
MYIYTHILQLYHAADLQFECKSYTKLQNMNRERDLDK